MNGTGFKNKDEMRSAIDTFKAELGRLENWDSEALGELLAWLANMVKAAQAAGLEFEVVKVTYEIEEVE